MSAPADTSFELMRTRSEEELAAVIETLNAASVPHRVSTTKLGFDISEVGRGDVPPEMFIMVEQADLPAARAALESSFASTSLPEEHFLSTASDEELLEILAAPQEWDPLVVVHARRLAVEKNLDPTVLVQRAEEHRQKLKLGKQAPGYNEASRRFGRVLLWASFAMLIGWQILYTVFG